MGDLHRHYLGWERFPEDLTDSEIAEFFTLSEEEHRAVRARRRSVNRLAIALQIGYMRMTGQPLNSVEMISSRVLEHIGAELGINAPRLASIRALYRRRRTLFEHQVAAKQILGLSELTEHGERALNGFMRREAGEQFTTADLARAARGWLADHQYIQLAGRRLRTLAVAARRQHEEAVLNVALAKIGRAQSQDWPAQLLETMPNGKTKLEWLRDGPASRKSRGISDQIAKINFLKELGANQLDLRISTGLLKTLARTMLYCKPTALRRRRSDRTTLELACFLRLQLLRLTDDGLDMIDYRVTDLWRQARDRSAESIANELGRHQRLVLQLMALANDNDISDAALRGQMRKMLQPHLPSDSPATQVGRIRHELATASKGANELLRAAAEIKIDVAPAHPLAQAMTTLTDAATAGDSCLPEGTPNPFGRTWARFIDQSDREAAMGAYRAATLLLLKRSLRDHKESWEPCSAINSSGQEAIACWTESQPRPTNPYALQLCQENLNC